MLRLLGLVISIGIADSLNPTTIAPALYLASADRARRQVAEFTLAMFGVYLLGGMAIALGPGELLLDLVPHPGRRLGYSLEVVAGVAMMSVAAFLWAYRHRLVRPEPGEPRMLGRSGAFLGASITAVELPTAFPYFTAIAAIVGANPGISNVVLLLVIFNLCFVGPLLAILVTLNLAGPNAQRLLAMGRARLEGDWPALVSVLALLAGVFVTLLGATGIAGLRHGHLGRVFRRLHKLLHP